MEGFPIMSAYVRLKESTSSPLIKYYHYGIRNHQTYLVSSMSEDCLYLKLKGFEVTAGWMRVIDFALVGKPAEFCCALSTYAKRITSVMVRCLQCRDLLATTQRELGRNRGRYCSMKCFHEWRRHKKIADQFGQQSR